MLFSHNYDYSGKLAEDEFCLSGEYENNISKHILIGEKLRRIKSKTCPSINEYHVIDILPHRSQRRTACSVNSKNKKSKDSNKKPRKTRRGTKEKCPLRVLELSYPSKRHCLETWKSRNETLPIHMIERLRKIINDENPRAPVRDAINFFKITKTKRRKCKNMKKVISNKRREQLKLLCGRFGYKIMDILRKPVRIELSSDLTRLAYIIDQEVSDILYNSGHSISDDHIEFQDDVVKKIAVWIDGVLEESSHRLFLEDLRDMEEEEGPVLDLLDELFYKASVIFESDNKGKYSNDLVQEFEANKPIYIVRSIDKITNDNVYETNSDNSSKGDEMRHENKLIDEIFADVKDHDDTTEVHDTTPTIKEENIDSESTNLKDVDLKQLREYINFILTQILEEAYYAEYFNKINKNTPDTAVVNPNDNNNENDSDDSDIEYKQFRDTKDSLVVHSAHDSESKSEINLNKSVKPNEEISYDTIEDGNKKVKFNNNDIDNGMELMKTLASHTNTKSNIPITKTRSVEIHHDKISKTIYLSDPSPYLLSEADETWPDSTSFHSTKSLTKVSKSVISLGDLVENEEEILSQSVSDKKSVTEMHSTEVLNDLLNSKEVENEINVSIHEDSTNDDNKDTMTHVEKDMTTDETVASTTTLEEPYEIGLKKTAIPAMENKDNVTKKEDNLKSSLIISDKDQIFMKKYNQKKNSLTIKKMSHLNIVQVCNDNFTNIKVEKKNKRTQHSPELSSKSIQSNIETSENVLRAIPKKGVNEKTEENKYKDSPRNIDNIEEYLEVWLQWLKLITSHVESLQNKDSISSVKWHELNSSIAFNSKAWIRQSKELHKRLVNLKCKLNKAKIMPYKCYCNKNIQNQKHSKHFL